MWNNYFYQIRKKYSMRVSLKEPLVINLDGKDVTKDNKINLFVNYNGGFLDAMEKTVEYFTKKYNCLSIFGADEVSFIFTNPLELIDSLNSDCDNSSNEIIAVFSQYFFNFFKKQYTEGEIYWHGKCFSIPSIKINSFIKYKKKLIKNVITTYFLKKMNIKNAGKMLETERMELCKEYNGYEEVKKIENGIMYLNGERINVEKYINGEIEVEKGIEKSNDYNNDFFDITKWDE